MFPLIQFSRLMALLAVGAGGLGGATELSGATWFVSPTGQDTHSGTSNAPFATLMRAQAAAASNDVVYLRGGAYWLSHTNITATNSTGPYNIVNHLTKSGISYVAYPGERPVFDFSQVQPVSNRVTAFLITATANNCVFRGFDVVGVQVTIRAGQANNTQSECFRVAGGSRNRFEQLVMRDGMGIGWYLTAGQSNLVLNCDAYHNRGLDSLSLGNVDGFGIHGTSPGHTGNVLRGCRAWFNSDDGFDLINCDAPAVIEYCWAFYNGYFTNFASSGGDANGFKSGGYGITGGSYPTPVPRHVTRFSLAVRNRANGFYANHHPDGLDFIQNTAYWNGADFNLLCNSNNVSGTNDTPGFNHLLRNNLGFRGTQNVIKLDTNRSDVAFNYFTLPVSVTSNDFLSLDESLLTAPRQANGDLPNIALLQLVGASDLRDAGTNAGFAFAGSAPDLGAFEYGGPPPPTLAITRAAGQVVLRATGGPGGGTNYLVASSTATAPLDGWSKVATNVFTVNGTASFTNSLAPEAARVFYQVRLP